MKLLSTVFNEHSVTYGITGIVLINLKRTLQDD